MPGTERNVCLGSEVGCLPVLRSGGALYICQWYLNEEMSEYCSANPIHE